MIVGNYDQVLQLISRSSGLSIEEIERKIEARRAKLSGLISKEGAAQIVASELGINFEKQKMKICELLTGMKRINVIGKIVKMNRVIEYNKNGRSGKIGSFLLADDTSNIRVVLWDTNHISLLEKGEIAEGDCIEICSGDIRNSELHLTGFADIKKTSSVFEKVQEKAVIHDKKIEDIRINDNISVRAFVVQIFGPTFFYVCPECEKKASSEGVCITHGKIAPKKRAILNFILDDGSGNIRSVLFSEQAAKVVSAEEMENAEIFMRKREEIIGKEYIIEGACRKNKFSESVELIVHDIKELDLDKIIEELEAKH